MRLRRERRTLPLIRKEGIPMMIRETTPFAIAALVSLAASGAVTTPARAQNATEDTGAVL